MEIGGWRDGRGSESLVVTGHPLLPFLEAVFIKRETVADAEIFSTEELIYSNCCRGHSLSQVTTMRTTCRQSATSARWWSSTSWGRPRVRRRWSTTSPANMTPSLGQSCSRPTSSSEMIGCREDQKRRRRIRKKDKDLIITTKKQPLLIIMS